MTKGCADAASFPKHVAVVRTESSDGKFSVNQWRAKRRSICLPVINPNNHGDAWPGEESSLIEIFAPSQETGGYEFDAWSSEAAPMQGVAI
jgi:hypothetical protein